MSRASSDLTSLAVANSSVSTSHWKRISVTVSIIFHVALLCALAIWYVGRRSAEPVAKAADSAVAATAAPARKPLPSPEVTSKQVDATLQRARETFAEASTAEQLTQLEAKAEKLQSLSSPEAVAEIAEKFEDWAPTTSRASEPAEAPVGDQFDFDTAQIHEVIRTADGAGQWNYRTVLLDKEGRTFEVEIDREQGEKTYATFASLKKFPLAEQVYRQIAMGLIDRALESERTATVTVKPETSPTTPPPAESTPAEATPVTSTPTIDDRDPFDDSDAR